MATETKGKIAIIGSGLIGKSWSVLFCRAGYEVNLYDIDEKQVSSALSGILESLQELERKGLLKNSAVKSAQEAHKLVNGCNDISKAIEGAIYVQENTPENVEIKKKVFANLDDVVKNDDIILASSTSCIVPSRFTEELKHRKQCIVAHPVNPPHYCPLVEIVPAPWTESSVVEKTRAIMKDIGQAPVTLKKEINGFLLNRIQYAIIMEGWRLVEDGVCSPEDVDVAMSRGLGLRYSFMGPFETMHLNAGGILDYCEKYGANIEKICEEQCQSRQLHGSSTARVIHDAMCQSSVPVEKLDERRAWRDKRLAALAVHQASQES